MAEERHNKIYKVAPENFSIKMLYDMFLDFLQEGDDGWELIRNKPWPYGGILKIPNWKEGEYGYLGMMYGQIKGSGKNHKYSVNGSSSYGGWAIQPDTLKRYIARQTMNLNTEEDYRYSKNKVQRWSVKSQSTRTTKRYDFSYGKGVVVEDVPAESTKVIVSTKSTQLSGIIRKGTYITIANKEVVVTKDTSSYPHTYEEEKKDKDGNVIYDEDGNPETQTITEYYIDIEFYPAFSDKLSKGQNVVLPSKDKETVEVFSDNRGSDTGYYYLREAEHFYTNADVIWFNMFKQCEPKFDWNELMENTRKNPCAKRLGWSWYSAAYPTWDTEPPIYPGEGCPVIASDPTKFSSVAWDSTQDGSEDSETPSSQTQNHPEYVNIYMSKTKHNANLAVNYRDWWDMAQVGFFEPFASDYEYQFPAMVMSSNIGVRPCNQLVGYGGIPYPYEHMQFDYTQGNKSWGHSMLGYSATWWDGKQDFLDNHACSQTQAMLPNGKWESFFNYGIRSDYYYNHTYGKYAHGYKEPERVDSKYFITTTMTQSVEENYNIIPYGIELNTNKFNLSTLDAEIALQNKQEYSLQSFYLGVNNNENDRNMICAVPSLYAVSRPVTRYGLYKNPNDEKDLFLIMPNCWEDRPWHYQQDAVYLYTDKNKTEEQQQDEYDKYRDWGKNMNIAMNIGTNTSFEEVESYTAKTKETD